MAHPLNRLLQKDVKFIWDQGCQDAFKSLKEQLITSPILGFPDTNRNYTLYTDASDIGIGAVLTQNNENGTERVISYASKAFSGAEKNWSTTEKEAFAIVWSLHYFYPYVYGRQFKVFTDHRALQWLKGMKHPNGKLARWIMKLQEYDYSVEHKPSSLMQHADALSRAPISSIQVARHSASELQELQDLDAGLSTAKSWVMKGSRPEQRPKDGSTVLHVFGSLCIDNNLVRRKWIDDTGDERLQIILPKFITPMFLEEAHEQVGHMGITKTFDTIQRTFYWPGFFKSVEEYCASCERCAKNKTVPRPRWPLKPIDVVPIPFYMIGVDIIGPLKTTRSGKKYIMSVIDYYTKYAEAEALPNQEAETVVRVLEQIFARHGMPSVLITDQGRNFESHLVASMCQLFGIKKRRTTAYHPQTDGLYERFNAILKALLRMRVNQDKDDWDEQLPHALLAYRISKQSSTGVTPFKLLYGRDARLPLGIDKKEVKMKPTHGPAKYLEDLKKRQGHLREIVRKRLQKAQEQQKQAYDARHRSKQSKPLAIGETVLLKNFRASGLQEKFLGPYIIVAVRDGNYEIESLVDKKRKIVHFNSLKPFKVVYNLEQVEEDNTDLHSDESDSDEVMFDPPFLMATDRERDIPIEVNRPYNLRRDRRPPERYGAPVTRF